MKAENTVGVEKVWNHWGNIEKETKEDLWPRKDIVRVLRARFRKNKGEGGSRWSPVLSWGYQGMKVIAHMTRIRKPEPAEEDTFQQILSCYEFSQLSPHCFPLISQWNWGFWLKLECISNSQQPTKLMCIKMQIFPIILWLKISLVLTSH